MASRIDLDGPWRTVVRAPMVRIVLPFVVGIVLSMWIEPLPMLMAGIMFLLTPVAWGVMHRGMERGARWVHGLVLLLWCLCFGMAWQVLRDPRASRLHVEVQDDREGPWLMRIMAINGTSERTLRADAWVEALWRDGQAVPRKGMVMLVLLQDSGSTVLVPGDRLWVDAALAPIARMADPGGFDRRRWAASRGIGLEAFAPVGQWHVVGHSGHWTAPFAHARHTLSEWLDGSTVPAREKALVKALILGQRDELDGEQRTAFARSGTIHVLAVSGMHVGLIYAMFGLLLGWWGGGDRARIARGVVILLALWGYAGLTGGSPSVLRATIMFSLFTVANMAAQRTDHLNSLFAAALLLLLWDPAMVSQIGFQLSFLAVLGIILFYRPLRGLWSPKGRVPRGIWSLVVVSLSAQLLTTPVSLYIFKAFPVWFLPANIIVVTLVGVAVNGAVALILLHKLPWIGDAVTWGTTLLLRAVGEVTDLFAHLPGAYPAIRISGWDVVLLYMLIAALAAWWQWRWQGMRWMAAGALAFLLGGWALRAERAWARKAFVVYDERDGVLASMVQGRSLVLLADSTTLAGDARIQRKVETHERAIGADRADLVDPASLRSDTIRHCGGTLVASGLWCSSAFSVGFLSEDGGPWPERQGGGALDVVVLHGTPGPSLPVLERLVSSARQVVLAGGVAWKTRMAVHELCAREGVYLHDVRRDGAFVLER